MIDKKAERKTRPMKNRARDGEIGRERVRGMEQFIKLKQIEIKSNREHRAKETSPIIAQSVHQNEQM